MAGVRQNKYVMARAVLVAMAVAVFVAMGGLPAQAQGHKLKAARAEGSAKYAKGAKTCGIRFSDHSID